jgi:hypothetical protein
MRDASQEITKLCEACWERVADATRGEQQYYIAGLFRLLGWDLAIPFTPRAGSASLSASPYVLRAPGHAALTTYFVLPGTLEPPSSLVERGLDFCHATRVLVDEARSLNVQYVFITDLYRSYLYDARAEELLLWTDDPKGFTREFTAVIERKAMERGALDELRHPPRSLSARQLREWSQRWTTHMATRGRIDEDTAGLVIDRLFVVRYLFDRDILRRTKDRLLQRFVELVARASGSSFEGVGHALSGLFHDMWFDWRMDLFEPEPDLEPVLENDALSVPLLREFALLSRAKFNVATLLESFNCGDPAEKLRVRMVPEFNEERDAYLNHQSLGTIDQARIELDLAEEGYRAIPHWFDRVVALYERLEADFDSRTSRDLAQAEDVDLFAWSQHDRARPSACADQFAHACEHGFGMYYNSPRQHRIARLMLTLHLIDRYAERSHPVNRFPGFHNVLMKRPLVLPHERGMNAQAALDPYMEVEYRR